MSPLITCTHSTFYFYRSLVTPQCYTTLQICFYMLPAGLCTSLCCCTSNLNAGSSAPAAVFAKKVQTAQMNKTGQQNYFLQ